MTESEAEDIPVKLALPIVQTPQDHTVSIPQDRDRINNVKQKESALHKAGVNRYKAFQVVARSLVAKKWVDEPDLQGNIKRIQVDDVPRQQWAAEMVAKYFGDFVTKPEGEQGGIRQLIIIRPDSGGVDTGHAVGGEAARVKRFSRPIRVQSEALSGDVQLMGNGQDKVVDIPGHDVLGADTE